MSSASAASGIVGATVNVASGNFFRKNANYIGGALNTLWVGLLIYSLYLIHTVDSATNPNKKYYYIGPVVGLLSIVIANVFYVLYATNKNRPSDKLESAKFIYANVSMIPIYLAIATVVVIILVSMKS